MQRIVRRSGTACNRRADGAFSIGVGARLIRDAPIAGIVVCIPRNGAAIGLGPEERPRAVAPHCELARHGPRLHSPPGRGLPRRRLFLRVHPTMLGIAVLFGALAAGGWWLCLPMRSVSASSG